MNLQKCVPLVVSMFAASFVGCRANAAGPQIPVATASELAPHCFVRVHPFAYPSKGSKPDAGHELSDGVGLRSDDDVRCDTGGHVVLVYVYLDFHRPITGNTWQMVGNVASPEHETPNTIPGNRDVMIPGLGETYAAAWKDAMNRVWFFAYLNDSYVPKEAPKYADFHLPDANQNDWSLAATIRHPWEIYTQGGVSRWADAAIVGTGTAPQFVLFDIPHNLVAKNVRGMNFITGPAD
jgi:hypothetical protein